MATASKSITYRSWLSILEIALRSREIPILAGRPAIYYQGPNLWVNKRPIFIFFIQMCGHHTHLTKLSGSMEAMVNIATRGNKP
jgi:hypothetical protein